MPGLAAQTSAAASIAAGGSTCGLEREQHDDERRAGRGERVEQRDLPADELQRRGRPALADQLDAVADHDDDVVGALGGGDGLGDQRRRRAAPGRRPAGGAGRRGRTRPSGSGPRVRMSAPRACVTVQPPGACARKPSSTVVIISRGWPSGIQSTCPDAPAQSPSWVCGSSALRADDGDAARTVGAAARPTRRRRVPGERQGAVVAQQDERAAGDLEVERRRASGAPMTAA